MKIFLGLLALVAVAYSDHLSEEQEEEAFIEAGEELAWNNGSVLADNGDAKLTVPELIEKYGYPVEVHDNITTEDGYILTAHRIPSSPKCPSPPEGKRVVWLQHGLLGDSANWLVLGPQKALAYMLADECYDVWMGNFRGNSYSKRHVTLKPYINKKAFWSFSWDQHGKYDLPALIDYALEKTGADGIYYIGHSMGTTSFWILMSERPEYNDKIKLMSAYAPVAYTKHMISPLKLIAPFLAHNEWLVHMFGMGELMPKTKLLQFFGQTACHQNSPIKAICSNILFLVCGYNFDQLDPEIVPTVLGHMPSGSSTRNLLHYGQGVLSGKFRKYDFGLLGNLKEYGKATPPEHNVEKVTAPVAFYWGQNDWLGTPKDVKLLEPRIPNLVRNHRVEHDKYNHLDFLMAKDNVELLYKTTIEFMKNY